MGKVKNPSMTHLICTDVPVVLPSVPEQPPDETANLGFFCLVGGDNRVAKSSAIQRSLATNVKRKQRAVG